MNIRFSPAKPNIVNCVVLTREDLEKGLTEFYVDLLSDPAFIREQLLDKNPQKGLHIDVRSLSEDKLVHEYAEMCIGESVLHEMASNGHPPIDYVVYPKNNGDLMFLASKEQNLPREWEKVNGAEHQETKDQKDNQDFVVYVNGKLFNIKGYNN